MKSEKFSTKIEVLGVKIDSVTFREALDRVEQLVQDGRGGEHQYIVKPNPEIVTFAQTDSEFKDILNSASLAPPDGVGLILASRALKLQGRAFQELKERVGGPELMEAILKLADDKGFSVFFYGARPFVVEKLAKVVHDKYPNLKISGFHHGFLEKDGEVVRQIKKAKPDILFVALGFPKQEKWIASHLNELKVPLSIAEGGSFDFISGEVQRAPAYLIRVGLEWFFRLLTDPSRITRQRSLLTFAWLVFKR
ncbi:MAG: WecB/TagA/CpsF family glycosyltransferase [Candidatus Woykebacteria bacterium]